MKKEIQESYIKTLEALLQPIERNCVICGVRFTSSRSICDMVEGAPQGWHFWADGTKYYYEPRPLETIGDIVVDGTGVTQVFVAYDTTSNMKLDYIGRLNQYLPLDENNPAEGISKFYKLLLIQ